MAIDQAFGKRGGISPIRFISFPAALTFPFAHSNWQNKIPVWLSSLSSALGNHSSTAPYSLIPSVPHPFIPWSAASSWQSMKHKQNVQLLPEGSEECACRGASLKTGGHLYKSPQGREHFNFSSSSPSPPLSSLALSPSPARSSCIPKQLLQSAAIPENHHQHLPASLLTGHTLAESLSAIHFI